MTPQDIIQKTLVDSVLIGARGRPCQVCAAGRPTLSDWQARPFRGQPQDLGPDGQNVAASFLTCRSIGKLGNLPPHFYCWLLALIEGTAPETRAPSFPRSTRRGRVTPPRI